MPALTIERVLEIAKAEVAGRQWPWLKPVRVRRRREWMIFGKQQWHVVTNARSRGATVFLVIDDESGRVMKCEAASR